MGETNNSPSFLERFATSVDGLRRTGSNLWKLAVLMAKGAYLTGERKRLFTKLGEQAFERLQKGQLKDAELEPIAQQLARLTKKLELEEILVRNVRFGSRGRPSKGTQETTVPGEA